MKKAGAPIPPEMEAAELGLMHTHFTARDGRVVTLPDGHDAVEFINCSYLGLDTHPLLWYAAGAEKKLGPAGRKAFRAYERGEAAFYVPAPVVAATARRPSAPSAAPRGGDGDAPERERGDEERDRPRQRQEEGQPRDDED